MRADRLRTAVAALATITVLGGVTACGSDDDTSATESSSRGVGGAFPVSITSSLGTAEIPEAPERVVTLGWGSTEAALALGVVPVGMRDMKSDSGTDDGILPWVKDKLGGATPELISEASDSIPFEKIAALDPDLILSVQSGLTVQQYGQLSEIAPTVGQPGKAWQTSWQDQTTIVGKALGRDREAAQLVDDTDKRIAQVKSEHPEFAGKTVATSSATASEGLNYYFDTDPRNQLLEAMGFTALPALKTLRESVASGKFAAPVSWENVGQYSPDVLVTWFGDDEMKSATESNPVFSGLSAVRGNAYVPLVDPPMVFAVSSPNVLDLPWLLDRYVPKLSAAAKAD